MNEKKNLRHRSREKFVFKSLFFNLFTIKITVNNISKIKTQLKYERSEEE